MLLEIPGVFLTFSKEVPMSRLLRVCSSLFVAFSVVSATIGSLSLTRTAAANGQVFGGQCGTYSTINKTCSENCADANSTCSESPGCSCTQPAA